jgi:large subunit ribosomal protein L29
MPNKFMQDLKDLSIEDIQEKIEVTEKDFIQLKFDHASKGLDSPIRIRKMRRDIARMHTELKNRELEGASEEAISKRSKIRKRRRKS